MAPEAKLGQLLMPLVVEADLADLTGLARWRLVGGAVLLGRPGPGLGVSLAEVQAAAGELPLLIASDEEGGTVQRLTSLLGELPSAASVAATRTPEEAGDLATAYGSAMADLGVGMVLAPVVDVGAGPGIGSRAYSDSPEVVAAYGTAVAEGFLAAGVVPVLKHFPGHGRASGDSHDTLPTTPLLEELLGLDLRPYADLLAVDGVAVMVGHLDVPGLTDGVPASLSEAAINGLLRGDLGFEGLVITDSLAMGALAAYQQSDAVRLALNAGADMVIVSGPEVVADVIDHLSASIDSGGLSWDVVENSVLRILATKGLDPCELR